MEIKPSRDNPTNPGAIERLIEDADWLGAYVARHAMNNSARHKAEDINKVLEAARAELARLQAENERLRRVEAAAREAQDSLAELIAESFGVAGLHMNGDIAPWAEIDTGGRFEGWLEGFDRLREALEGGK